MKLDPCPWCRKEPTVYNFIYDGIDMVTVHCCHADLSCAEEDAEQLWNWVKEDGNNTRRRSGRISRRGNQDTCPESDFFERGIPEVPF